MKTIDVKDALILEEHEQLEFATARTRKAIADTYKSEFTSRGRSKIPDGENRPSRTQNHPFTKKRRKLPGKRVWKNKAKQYEKLQGALTKNLFNSQQRQQKAIKRVYQRQNRLRMVDED